MCCRNVNLSEKTQHLDNGNGVCKHLDDASSKCTIYDSRPEICRVDLQFKNTYSKIYTWNEFVKLNLSACDELNKSEKQQSS